MSDIKIKEKNFKSGNYSPDTIIEPYSLFAVYYDDVLDYLDFNLWSNYIKRAAKKFLISGHKVLEIASGTGHLYSLLSEHFVVTPSDNSTQMMEQAKRNYPDIDISYIDMKNFKTIDTYDIVVSFNDNINYLLNKEELSSHFESVYNCLNKNGMFIFDCTPLYNIKKNFNNKVLLKEVEGAVLRWHNSLKEEENLVYATVDIFNKDNGEIYREVHTQRIHSSNMISNLLKKTGFKNIQHYDGFSFKKAKSKSEHDHFIAFT